MTPKPEYTTPQAHGAWLDSLPEPEKVVAYTQNGYRYWVVMASYVKRQLVTQRTTTGDRLQLLERMGALLDRNFTTEVLALIEPADDVSAKMIQEAMSLDRGLPAATPATGGLKDERAYGVLTSWEVMGHLTTLNPSLIEAMRHLCVWWDDRHPVTRQPPARPQF